MVVPIVATAPWWLGPAINTVGVGALFLHDYLNKNNINLNPFKSQELDIDDPSIQWRDTNKENNVVVEPNLVDNSISRFVPTAKEKVEIKVVPEVKTDTTFKASPPNNNNNGKKKKSNDDKYWKAARAAALWELAGKGVETVNEVLKDQNQTPDTVVEDQSETGKDGYTLGQKVTAFLNNQDPETRYGVNNYGGDRIPLSEIIRAQDYNRRRNRFELTPQEQKTTIMSPLEQEMYW